MLKSIDINNFTLINSVRLEFTKGLNIIIGETGAGKSIIIDALLQSLGDRASSDLVKNGSVKAIIESEFELNTRESIVDFLNRNEIDSDSSTLITRREISAKGVSRCFINDAQIAVSTLNSFGEIVADFHGQHDHQMLLKPENHLLILDNFSRLDKLKKKYQQNYNHLLELISQHKKILLSEKESSDLLGNYKLELKEISRINPQKDEDNQIETELTKIENSELLFNLSEELYNILENSENGLRTNLAKAKKIIENLSNFDNAFAQYTEETGAALISIYEIINFISDYKSSLNFDSEEIEVLRERSIQLKGLKKKYGSLDESILRIEFLTEKLDYIEHFDDKLKESTQQIIECKDELAKLAFELSESRKKSALNLEIGVLEKLNQLGLENSIFNVKFKSITLQNAEISDTTVNIDGCIFSCSVNGIDEVEYYISTNKGESPKPLIQVASGGEISRLMLAIKSVIADTEQIPILVFDEIDTGISGRIAGRVGLAMKELSKTHQIIAITHLAQIAVQGDNIISVIKKEDGERTEITARNENEETKIKEIAKLISANEVTDISIKNIHELMKMNFQD
jgi:DNA repair protein RecN (Recombination protein N)